MIFWFNYSSIIAMRNILQFTIYKSDSHYVAEGSVLPVVTQGKTLDELTKNIEEAVALHLDGENLAELGISPKPSILANLELSLRNA